MTGQIPGTLFTAIDDVRALVPLEPGRVKPGSVLKATGANVVVFAFDAGAELREHSSQQPILLQVLAGAVSVHVDGQTIALTSGGLLHIEPGVPHSVIAEGQSWLQLTVLMIDSPGESHIPLAD
jgi:quercetin dioxygenase-like cupin family protein